MKKSRTTTKKYRKVDLFRWPFSVFLCIYKELFCLSSYRCSNTSCASSVSSLRRWWWAAQLPGLSHSITSSRTESVISWTTSEDGWCPSKENRDPTKEYISPFKDKEKSLSTSPLWIGCTLVPMRRSLRAVHPYLPLISPSGIGGNNRAPKRSVNSVREYSPFSNNKVSLGSKPPLRDRAIVTR